MQLALDLVGGYHAGPLFIAALRRAPMYKWRGAARWRFTRTRVPSWTDRSLMHDLIELKTIYTRCTGFQFSVDHIVPLRHPLVCGFHCPDNFEMMLLLDNQRKSNLFWPDMPEVQQELL